MSTPEQEVEALAVLERWQGSVKLRLLVLDALVDDGPTPVAGHTIVESMGRDVAFLFAQVRAAVAPGVVEPSAAERTDQHGRN